MNPLIVVLPYHKKDQALAVNLLDWIHELDADIPALPIHSCLLVADPGVTPEDRTAILVNAKRTFRYAGSIVADIPKAGFAPNHMFLSAAKYIWNTCKLPWLWLEPDAVPLRSTWIDELADEYSISARKFMGPIIEADQPGLPKMHLPGTAIYSRDAFPLYDRIASLKTANVAFDMEAAPMAVSRSANTVLIQHLWGTKEDAPKFFPKLGSNPVPHSYTLEFLKPSACLFHRCKDGSLIPLLREVRAGKIQKVQGIGGVAGFVNRAKEALLPK